MGKCVQRGKKGKKKWDIYNAKKTFVEQYKRHLVIKRLAQIN
jgi:hypothetical protein